MTIVGKPVTITQNAAKSAAVITVTPASKDFGAINIGRSAPQQVTITNLRLADLSINSIEMAGNDAAMFSLAALDKTPMVSVQGHAPFVKDVSTNICSTSSSKR